MTATRSTLGPSALARPVAACLIAMLAAASSAQAHKLKVFAAAEGTTISGYAYFPGGGRAKHIQIQILGPQDQPLAKLTTNAKGEFSFEAKYACDHIIVADAGDGHAARFRVGADELVGALQPLPGQGKPAAPPAAAPAPAVAAPVAGVSESQLAALIAKAVGSQVRPLREQLDQFEERRRMTDVLAGIGYIFGIMGLILFFKSRRGRADDSPDAR